MHSKGEQETSSPQADMTAFKVKLLPIVQQSKGISDSIFNPMLIQSTTLCGLLQKSPQTPQNNLNSDISSLYWQSFHNF